MSLVIKECRNCKYCIPASYGKMYDKCLHKRAREHNVEYADIAWMNFCHGNYFELKDIK